MLGTYTMSYDTLLYYEYTREFTCAYSHVHIRTKTPKLVVSEIQKNAKIAEHAATTLRRTIELVFLHV